MFTDRVCLFCFSQLNVASFHNHFHEQAKDGVSKYFNNAKDDLTAMIKLWGPSDCIQFVLPMHIRLPFRHLVSFFWTAYVSFTRGAIEVDSPEDEQKA